MYVLHPSSDVKKAGYFISAHLINTQTSVIKINKDPIKNSFEPKKHLENTVSTTPIKEKAKTI